MTSRPRDTIRKRDILFCGLHPDPRQAESAEPLLERLTGVSYVEAADRLRLRVHYDINHVTLETIEQVLIEVGFHLDNGLLSKLKRALYYYSEEVQQQNLDCGHGKPNCTEKVFINRYEKLQHGCRDERPEHWRKYL